MEPIEYLRAIRRRWLIVAFATLVFVGGAWATTAFASPTVTTPTYQSNVILLRTGGLSLNTMTALVSVRPVSERVAEVLGFNGDPTEPLSQIGANFDGESGFLEILATAESPEEARNLANAYAKALIGYIRGNFVADRSSKLPAQIAELQQEVASLDAQLAQPISSTTAAELFEQRVESQTLLELLTEAYRQSVAASLGGAGLTIIQPATISDEPSVSEESSVPTSLPARLALGAILGLAVGIGLALALERFDTRIRSREAAEEHFQLPVLAEIPTMPRASRGSVVGSDPSSPSGEAFSLLGAEIVREPAVYGDGDGNGDAGARRGPPQTILVTSAGHGEGKSTVVANLAVALSEMGKRVLVVSCDFRRPVVHRLFGIKDLEGLAEALDSANGKQPVLEGHIKNTSFSDIWVVPTGSSSKRSSELLSSDGMRRAMSEARSAADVILLDTAPILAGGDASQLLPDADAVLVVARSGVTTQQLAESASGLLRRLRAPVLGVAFNAAESPAASKGVRAK